MVKCPNCQRIIMDAMQTGGYKIRSRMILFTEGKAIALCPSCKHHVEVPIILSSTPKDPCREKIVISK